MGCPTHPTPPIFTKTTLFVYTTRVEELQIEWFSGRLRPTHMTRRSAPVVTLLLVAANLLAYALELASGGQAACEAYGLVPARFMRTGAVEPLFSSLFLHDPGSLIHLGGNMAFLAIFGVVVERALGSLSFLGLYLLAGAAGGLMHVLVAPGSTDPLVGASGAIFGVLAVAGVLRPRLMGFVAAFVGLNVWHAFVGGDGNVSFGCHIGGFVAGFLVVALLRAVDSEALEAA
jgi:membrane associated rhomboid family serine protease